MRKTNCDCPLHEIQRLALCVRNTTRYLQRDGLSEDRRAFFAAKLERAQSDLTREQRKVRRLLGLQPESATP